MNHLTNSETTEKTVTRVLPQSPEFSTSISASARAAIDEALAVLQASKSDWVALGVTERITLLEEIQRDFLKVADRWIAAGLAAKGVSKGTFAEGEEWAIFAAILRNVRFFRQALLDIRDYGRPRIPGGVTTRPDGQVVARVFPSTRLEGLLLSGTAGEIWLEPGPTSTEAIQNQARRYRQKDQAGQIALVLGAGNVSCIAPVDVVSKLFGEDQVVVLKMNPLNDYLGPLIEAGCRVLIKRGFLRLVYGGVAEGEYLCHHPAVDTIHLTGSHTTYEAIVFGPGAEGAKRKAARLPRVTKPVTAELGGVNPVIVVPGPWTETELRQQTVKLATWQVINAGFNCLNPHVILQHKSWPRREMLVREMGATLSRIETRLAYYPGAMERQAAFVTVHPEAQQFGRRGEDRLPWTLIANVDPANQNDIVFTTEPFCGLCAETALEAANLPEFIQHAVEFANETLWGSLCAYILIHPNSLRDRGVAAALEEGIARLRYGTICVNFYVGLAYELMVTPWGAFPGHPLDDIQSGVGKVNNIFMFDRPQKVVYRAPFNRLDPAVVTYHHFSEFTKQFVHFSAKPSIGKFLGLAATALR